MISLFQSNKIKKIFPQKDTSYQQLILAGFINLVSYLTPLFCNLLAFVERVSSKSNQNLFKLAR